MPDGPQAPTSDVSIPQPPVVEQHPALVKEEGYNIAAKSTHAVVVVLAQAQTNDGDWNPNSEIRMFRYEDFPPVEVEAVGTEGEPGYVAAHTIPGYTMVKLRDGSDYRLDGVQIAGAINATRDLMTTAAPSQEAIDKFAPMAQVPAGINMLQFGVLVDYMVQEMVAADQAAKAAQQG